MTKEIETIGNEMRGALMDVSTTNRIFGMIGPAMQNITVSVEIAAKFAEKPTDAIYEAIRFTLEHNKIDIESYIKFDGIAQANEAIVRDMFSQNLSAMVQQFSNDEPGVKEQVARFEQDATASFERILPTFVKHFENAEKLAGLVYDDFVETYKSYVPTETVKTPEVADVKQTTHNGETLH